MPELGDGARVILLPGHADDPLRRQEYLLWCLRGWELALRLGQVALQMAQYFLAAGDLALQLPGMRLQ
ncbi:hypothetical protein PBOI14_65370 [Pseudomonas sp. Boi14]|nr:hypothetical protein PBOI14_65370 [Pseudomonas sp. Boi14]